MNTRIAIAITSIFSLSIRCGVDHTQPWFSILATGIAVSSLWIGTFWWIKVYGLAWQSTVGESRLRATAEYGLPIVILVAIIQHGDGGNPIDLALAALIWWLVGSPCKSYREQWRPHAIKHVRRFLLDCGINSEPNGQIIFWPLHLATVIFVLAVISVPGLSS